MLKVQILIPYSHCDGKAYLPVGDVEDSQGHKYTRHIPCPYCEGSGKEPKWIDLQDFAIIMHKQSVHTNTIVFRVTCISALVVFGMTSMKYVITAELTWIGKYSTEYVKDETLTYQFIPVRFPI